MQTTMQMRKQGALKVSPPFRINHNHNSSNSNNENGSLNGHYPKVSTTDLPDSAYIQTMKPTYMTLHHQQNSSRELSPIKLNPRLAYNKLDAIESEY